MAAEWSQQVVSWTGDASSNRLIPTSFDLSVGTVFVWVWPLGGLNNCMRTNSMSGTIVSTTLVSPSSGGITAFESGGFRVKDNGTLPSVNQLAVQYTALVFRDTSGGLLMTTGTYHGIGALGPTTVGVVLGSKVITGGGVSPWDIGREVLINGFPFNIENYIDATHFTITQAYDGSTGTVSFSAPAAGQSFNTTLTLGCRMALVFGRSQVFRSQDFSGLDSVHLPINASTLTNQIVGGTSGETDVSVDTNANVNNSALTYYWVAFSLPGAVQAVFDTYKATGNGAAQDIVLPFTPIFVVARPFDAGAGPESVWRGPLQTGLNANYIESGVQSTQGIRAFGTNKFNLGSLTGSLGMDVYGFALATGDVNHASQVNINVEEVDVDFGGPDDLLVAELEAIEGRGLVINVDRTDRWFLERFDIRRRREEHKG